MTVVDARTWTRRNMWPLPSGELAVRPGLRLVGEISIGARIFVGGFSVDNPQTGETWHYLLSVATSGLLSLRIDIFDEDFVAWQELSLYVDVIPRGVSFAVIEDEIIIASPDFPTLWGLVGTGIKVATPVASDNPGTSVLDPVPRGICTRWGNRVVIADGFRIFVSDPIAVTGGSSRTFTAVNQNNRPAPIYGIHEGAGGMLVACTAKGTWGLDAAAAAVGVVGSNGADWRILNHHKVVSFDSTCVVRGRVFGLTQRGYTLLDVDTDDDVAISEPMMPRALSAPRLAREDYRAASMFSGDDGPIIADLDNSAVFMSDRSRGHQGWWTAPGTASGTFRVRGVLHDRRCGLMLVEEAGIWRIMGNFDGTEGLPSGAFSTQPTGVLMGALPAPPSANRTARRVQVAAALGGAGSLSAAVRGDLQSATPPADSRGFIADTDDWSASKTHEPTPLRSTALDFDLNSDDMAIEVGANRCLARVSSIVDIDFSEQTPQRRTDRS